MSRIRATVRFLHAWQHPDEIADEVEAELRFHMQMRARANIEGGMKPEEAQLAARQSFGDFDRVKVRCCEISRSLPFDSGALRMGTHIAIAGLAGGAALWAVNVSHHNLIGLLRQLVLIAVLTCSFLIGRRIKRRTVWN
jgi:Flp pilus assembly protein TadB